MRLHLLFKCLVFSCLGALLLLGDVRSVHAQSVNEQVQDHFDQGIKYYVSGEYDSSILEFRKAHRLLPEPIFLYNIARAQVKLNRCEDAFETAERAISSDRLKGETRAKAQSVIASCRVFVTGDRVRSSIAEARQARARAEREELERTRITAERERIEAEKERTKQLREMKVEGGAASDEPRFGALGWIGAGFMVVGAGALTGTAIVSSTLSDQWDDYRAASAGGNLETYRGLRSDIEENQNIAKILLFSGVGLAAGGAAMVILDLLPSGSESAPSQALIPRLGPGGAGVDVRVEF